MTNEEAAGLYKLGFGPTLSENIGIDEYCPYIPGNGGGPGIEITKVFLSQVDMEAEIGNPPDDMYKGKYFAYLNPDMITWTIVTVK
jgi:hypothetical protein